MALVNSLTVVISVLCVVSAKDGSQYIQPCYREDPNFKKCFVPMIQKIMTQTGNGIPELNLPPLEPLIIPEINIQQGTEVVNYNIAIKDFHIFGIPACIIQDITVNFDKQDVIIELNIPVLRTYGDYNLTGKALVLPVRGDGVLKCNLTNNDIKIGLKYSLVDKKKGTMAQVKETSASISIKKTTADFSNLFNGDPLLGPATNQFLNENADEIIKEIKPVIEQLIAKIFGEIIGKLFKVQAFDYMFPYGLPPTS